MLTDLQKRCVELSFRHKLTHVSSVLSTVNLIKEIHDLKLNGDIFILGNGHAGLALYVALESLGKCDAEEMIKKHGVHPSRDPEHGISCSCGSLGQAETVAVGFALANPGRTIWLVTSDGACMEGSVYEAMRFTRQHCPNLHTFIIANGFGAYGDISRRDLPNSMNVTLCAADWHALPDWLRCLAGHYLTLTEEQYEELMK